MPRKAREQEFNVKLNIHLKHDPILARDITRFILLAIKLGEEEERKAAGKGLGCVIPLTKL
jgi:hypothetical protein